MHFINYEKSLVDWECFLYPTFLTVNGNGYFGQILACHRPLNGRFLDRLGKPFCSFLQSISVNILVNLTMLRKYVSL